MRSAGCNQPPSWLTEQQAPPEREGGGQHLVILTGEQHY
jgi:hypothetical protein